ncbi:hypothetical protein RhiirA4_490020 [Rhizophagus irregularis]|uniref:Uncharacterized protein n=1 Tax=Rhizophagus irregularis TaxID=588596 RepID=A0A2I1HV95_9GLOM|nr:hypothetical protein RhiirA4_490020 [Rhizophagus irregularis]
MTMRITTIGIVEIDKPWIYVIGVNLGGIGNALQYMIHSLKNKKYYLCYMDHFVRLTL